MRKIILFLGLVLVTALNYAQGTPDPESLTISFESSEGYTLGDIHNQNGWTSTGFTDPNTGLPGNIDSQVVSDERASLGTQSLRIGEETLFGPQTDGPVVGGFYEYDAPVDYTDAVISYDIYIEEVVGGNDYRFGVTGEDASGDGFFILVVDFDFENNIRVVDDAGQFVNVGAWVSDTWYNVRIEFTNSQAEYFIDDVSVGIYNILNDFDITGARFVHDNYGGAAFFDNFRTNDETLSNDNFVQDNNFVQFVNNNTLNLQSTTLLNEIEIFNLAGKRVITDNLNGNSEAQVSLNSLNQGVYIAKLETESGIHTFKFAK